MITSEREGQEALGLLFENMASESFTDVEKRFIREIRGKAWSRLTKHQRAVVARLIGWIEKSPLHVC